MDHMFSERERQKDTVVLLDSISHHSIIPYTFQERISTFITSGMFITSVGTIQAKGRLVLMSAAAPNLSPMIPLYMLLLLFQPQAIHQH